MKRKTIGERIATGWFEDTCFGEAWRRVLAREIDHAIRREKAAAWRRGLDAGRLGATQDDNPYRGRTKR